MIPYDDLVAALASWRARQGLPNATISPSPAVVAAEAPKPAARTAPPAAPPARVAAPPPLASAEEVDDSALLEEAHYDNEGNDFALAFGQPEVDAESTAIGLGPPSRDTVQSDDMPPPPPSRGRNW